ncbi:hypothetical protein [Prosthecobacter vanneervenii]|uniref:Putative membrane protein YphA (DoxX/SURF4 family) n=1 Tax=Prosthecobacter vanneervenii TaxID=48466 RepID=A0A7W7Y8U0_9BACT|nr:hypothetical protein [Prosthecobacter vanneervenii]MBB5031615.1 putative membrane protein YphA (DoxX/SURF4 family) [Prosthecobacter vanneervenii]
MTDAQTLPSLPFHGQLKRFFGHCVAAFFVISMFEPFGIFGQLTLTEHLGVPALVKWAGRILFGLDIKTLPGGSGDTTFNYVAVFCYAVLALLSAAVWCIADRRARQDALIHDWLRSMVRLYLAAMMMFYGIHKAIPLQFGRIGPVDLLQPVGQQSPMGMLWRFMATSPAYTMFSGLVEVLAGVLLAFRRTSLVGALITLGVMAQVVALNFCYDVPVKLFSSRLFLMSLFVAAPHASRLYDFFILNRATEAEPMRPRFTRKWLNALSFSLKWVVIVGFPSLLILTMQQHLQAVWKGTRSERLEGVWKVDEFRLGGEVLPPLATDGRRWSHLILQHYSNGDTNAVCQLMTGKEEWHAARLDLGANRLSFKSSGSEAKKKPAVDFALKQDSSTQITLNGNLLDKPVSIKMHRLPDKDFMLISRGFHWINESPFIR